MVTVAHGKFDYWISPDGLLLLEGWARDGLSDEDVAGKMHIAPSTLYEWKKRFPEITEALKSGKELPDYKVENALYQSALEGNTTAQIFWLKNRRPDKWRDKPELPGSKENGLLADLIDGLKDDE